MDRPKWRDALNKVAAEPACWGSSMLALKKLMPPARKASEAEVSSMMVMDGSVRASTSTTEAQEGKREMKC
jgi:hypothetical protein